MDLVKMVSAGVKLNRGSFGYYLLKINSKTKLEQIESKLINLKHLDDKNQMLVLEFDGLFAESDIHDYVLHIRDIVATIGFNLYSIQKHDSISTREIHGYPVLDWHESNKCSAEVMHEALIHEDPIRSGMRITHDGDIIITSFVSDNAEVIATGNIHVYGEARGRLIAGSGGNKKTRIFVAKFNAELISIGGIYRVIENKLPDSIAQKMVHISLDDKNHLAIVPIK